MSSEASFFDRVASADIWPARDGAISPFSIRLSAPTPSSNPSSSSSLSPSPFSCSLLCSSSLTSSASLLNLASFLPRLSSSLSLRYPSSSAPLSLLLRLRRKLVMYDPRPPARLSEKLASRASTREGSKRRRASPRSIRWRSSPMSGSWRPKSGSSEGVGEFVRCVAVYHIHKPRAAGGQVLHAYLNRRSIIGQFRSLIYLWCGVVLGISVRGTDAHADVG